MFDTHAHLNFGKLYDNIDNVVEALRKAGVERIVVPGTDIGSSKRAVELAGRFDEMYAAVGVHPGDVPQMPDEEGGVDDVVQEIRTLAKSSEKVVAIGEIGIDQYLIHKKFGKIINEELERQMDFFMKQMRLALDLKKAAIIHNRQSIKVLLRALNDIWEQGYADNVVFHCCEPDSELLNFAKEKSIFIGVDGDVTFDKAKQEFVKQVPLEKLVIETDSPFMMPEPIRQKKRFPNTPANLIYVFEAVCSLREESVAEVEQALWENSLRLFNFERV